MRKICLLLFVYLNATMIYAQDKDSLAYEFNYLVDLLEETHPDPYSAFGGKVMFHKEAFQLVQKIKTEDYDTAKYAQEISSFLSTLHDGHTFINAPKRENTSNNKYLPLALKVVSDGVFIRGVNESDKELLGSRLLAINDIDTDSLASQMSKYLPSENLYGAYNSLSQLYRHPELVAEFFPNNKESVILSIEMPNGTMKKVELDLTAKENWYTEDYATVPNTKYHKSYIYSEFTDDKKSTMYLRMSKVMSRESFLYMQDNNWDSLEGMLSNFYKYTLGNKEQPKDIDEAIKVLPSYAELSHNMLTEMQQAETENLIVDLRDNGGGFTSIVLPFLYMLYGDQYLDTDMGESHYRLISPLLMKKNSTTLEAYNLKRETNYKFGDYTFKTSSEEELTPEDKRENFIKESMGDAAQYINKLGGRALYTPKHIYVITNSNTFSAAYYYAFYLWKMGATVVGIPSAQSPNTFMEITEFELPYTGIKGSISNSMQYTLPVNDRRAKVFYPDIMLNYEDYKKHDFEQSTELFWLLDYIKTQE